MNFKVKMKNNVCVTWFDIVFKLAFGLIVNLKV